MFFDWKIQLEKIQITRDLKDDTIIYQGIRVTRKNDKVFALQQQEHKQQLFGSLKIHVPQFKLLEFTQA